MSNCVRGSTRRVTRGLTLLAVLFVANSALAANEDVRKAGDLYDSQQYAAARQAIDHIDRQKLSDADRKDLDNLSTLVTQALAGLKQAEQDLAAADKAFAAERWDEATGLYQSVSRNQFATASLRDRAAAQREAIADRKRDKITGSTSAGESNFRLVQDSDSTSTIIREERTETVQEPTASPLTPVGEMQLRDEIIWQRAIARMQELTARAQEASAASRDDEARSLAQQALQEVEAARAYAEPVSRYESARATVIQLQHNIESTAESHAACAAATEQAEIARRIAESRRQQEELRHKKIEQLFNQAKQLRQEQRFEEAAEVLRQILYIDPGNIRAREALDVAEDYASFHRQGETARLRGINQRAALTGVDEALIPWDYDVLYPKNWNDLTARRKNMEAGVAGRAEEDVELNARMTEQLPEVRFQDQPLDQVVEFLRDLTHVNITVDWEDLEANGVARDKPITLQLAQVSFRTVLNELMSQAGGEVRLAYAIGDSLLRIATKEKLDRAKVVLVYDIRDLLVNIPRFNNAARLDPAQGLQQLGQGGGAGGGGGGGGSGIFGGGQQGQNEGNDQGQQVNVVQEIMDIIRQTVEPDSWKETGGGDGSLRELNGQLIVYNTSDAHRQVVDLLTQLRLTRALQIALEARYLSVTNNFLEEIGVDLDFVFNQGGAGFDRAFRANGTPIVDPQTGAPLLVDRRFSRIGATPGVPPFGNPLPQPAGLQPAQPYGQAGLVPPRGGLDPHFSDGTPISVQQGSIALTNPGGVNTQVPGSLAQAGALNPAINIGGSFLDNLQVDFLIRATQANSRSSIVQAPRLLLFNGQRANILVGRARQYVASLNPVLAEGAVGFQPIPGVALSGVGLDVEGTISADRKYVTVTVRTQQAEEPSFERFEVQRASGNSPGAFITLLDQSFTTINTTVSIPDGGTVLLGGLKQAGEVEIEAGVPVLSKIPILKRAFTNTTTVKDTRTLLILLKAKIIIQHETEEEAFPTFNTPAG